ncbi:MAG: AbrB family transcriptional regulator, partial [Lysobacterales bacterium]
QEQPPWGAAQHTKWQAWGSKYAAQGRPKQEQPPRGAAKRTKWQAWGSKFHVAGLSRITTYFAAPIGAASEMTLMAERHGAQTDLVASAHSLRVLLVTLIIPFGFQWAGLHGLDVTLPGVRVVQGPGLALLAVLTGIGCWVMLKLKRTNPWFIGALAVSLLLTACGVTLSAIPQEMTNAAQLVIGISLGVRFTRSFVHLAPRWLGSVALATVGMIVLCAAFAWVLAQFTHLHWATLLLGTSPGGIAEMSITAKVLQLGVPVVTAFHVTRLAAVLMLAEPMYRWLYQGDQGDQNGRHPAE